MDHVWRFSYYTDTSTVTVHIRRLRAKIERDPDQPKYIETVWGVGYRFAAAMMTRTAALGLACSTLTAAVLAAIAGLVYGGHARS